MIFFDLICVIAAMFVSAILHNVFFMKRYIALILCDVGLLILFVKYMVICFRVGRPFSVCSLAMGVVRKTSVERRKAW